MGKRLILLFLNHAVAWMRSLIHASGVWVALLVLGCHAGGELGEPPSAPRISVIPGDHSVHVEWQQVDGAGAYFLYRFDSPHPSSRALQSRQAVSSLAVVDGLTNGTTYYLALTAVGQGGESDFSEIVAVTPQPPPSAPQHVVVTTGNGSVGLQWDETSGAQAYRIYRVRGSPPLADLVASTPGFEEQHDVSVPGFTAMELDNGVEYSFVVTAVNQSGESAPSAVVMATPGPFRAVSVGSNHSCVVDAKGEMWCWGLNNSGQVAGIIEKALSQPTQVGGLFTWKTVSAGANSTCGVTSDESIVCWGGGSMGLRVVAERPNVLGSALPTERWLVISAGEVTNCVVRGDGSLWCWGNPGTGVSENVTRMGFASDWIDVTVGNNSFCARKQDHSLWCWGDNSSGQLGTGSFEPVSRPTWVPLAGKIKHVTLIRQISSPNSIGHVCAIDIDDQLWCWGANSAQQLGVETNGQPSSQPLRVLEGFRWRDVVAAERRTCGVQMDGTLWCWGGTGVIRNDHTQTEIDPVPRQLSDDRDWVAVYAGESHTCASKRDGSLWCLGRNPSGQLGVQRDATSPEPPRILENMQSMVARQGMSCALSVEGNVWCWGDIAEQSPRSSHPTELPIGRPPFDDDNWRSPTLIDDPRRFIKLYGIGEAVCAITADHQMACVSHSIEQGPDFVEPLLHDDITFQMSTIDQLQDRSLICGIDGNNTLGCLTSDYFIERPAPRPIQVLEEILHTSNRDGIHNGVVLAAGQWREVATGGQHACALNVDLKMWCSGRNIEGQLGVPLLNESIHFIEVMPERTWRDVTAGTHSTCAIDVDDRLWCWGQYLASSLNANPFPSATPSTPIEIAPGTTWRTVETGHLATCGIKTDGSLWCWGYSSYDSTILVTPNWAVGSAKILRIGSLNDWVAVEPGDGFSCGLRRGGQLHCWGVNDRGQLGNGQAWLTEFTKVGFPDEKSLAN